MPTTSALHPQLLSQLRADTQSLSAHLPSADLDAQVRSCPGWDVRRLVRHLGGVHRWATEIVSTGQEAEAARTPDGDDAALLAWFDRGASGLVTTLAAADPGAPCWTFGPTPQLAAFWIRRQAHETAVHRWDAGTAHADPVDRPDWPDWFAEDGVDEVCEIFFPRQVRLGRQPALTDRVTLVSATTGRSWVLAGDGRGTGAGESDARVTAPAAVLDLLLWHRADLAAAGIDTTGDVDAARRVLAAALTP